MDYRLNKERLLDALKQWTFFLKKPVHLIACGGTAMTLHGVKASTKDIDFMVPDEHEYRYLINMLKKVGYKQKSGSGWQNTKDIFQFDIFCGNRIHTTELLESPLIKGNHTPYKQLSNIYIGILNDYDLIVSKLMRGTEIDFQDCVMLFEAHIDYINPDRLADHFNEMLDYHPVGENRIRPNMEIFLEKLYDRGFDNGRQIIK